MRLLVRLMHVVGSGMVATVMLRVTPLFEALMLRLYALGRHNLWRVLR